MKIIENKRKVYDFYSSVYEMSDAYYPKGYPEGLMLLYCCVNAGKLESCRIEVDFMEDIHDTRPKEIYSKETFLSTFNHPQTLFLKYKDEHLARWLIVGIYEGDEVMISGHFNPVLRVTCQQQSTPLHPLIYRIESSTYQYHEFPKEEVNDLLQKENMTLMMAIDALSKLSSHEELYQSYLHKDPFISVEGFSVKDLMDTKGFSLIEAYLCLVQLKENPIAAKTDLFKQVKVK